MGLKTQGRSPEPFSFTRNRSDASRRRCLNPSSPPHPLQARFSLGNEHPFFNSMRAPRAAAHRLDLTSAVLYSLQAKNGLFILQRLLAGSWVAILTPTRPPAPPSPPQPPQARAVGQRPRACFHSPQPRDGWNGLELGLPWWVPEPAGRARSLEKLRENRWVSGWRQPCGRGLSKSPS